MFWQQFELELELFYYEKAQQVFDMEHFAAEW